jgi:hypothetical protein
MITNKDYSKLKFSELIIELTEIWILWMKQNTISHDPLVSIELRRKAGEECEFLINTEYIIVSCLDNFFKNE